MSTLETGLFKGHELQDAFLFVTCSGDKKLEGFEFLDEKIEWVDDHGWVQYCSYFKDLSSGKCYGTWFQTEPEWGVFTEDNGLDIVTERIFEVVPKQVTKTIYEMVR